jgi:hypothetical protein
MCTSKRKNEDTRRIYEILQDCFDKTNSKVVVIFDGNFNARIGSHPVFGFTGTEQEKGNSNNGTSLKGLCILNNLKALILSSDKRTSINIPGREEE